MSSGGEGFNEVLNGAEKFGGNTISNSRVNLFRDCINNNNLTDLGFKGSKYTWTNKKYRNMWALILERLDRCLANKSWINSFPDSTVTHLARTHSDHCAILL